MKLRVLRLLPVVMLAFASCGEIDEFNKGAGRIDVSASVDTSVETSVSTRAIANAMHVELDSCTLSIVKTDGTAAPFVGKFADYNSEMEIGVGTYTVTLEYGSAGQEGFNKPYYYASEEVTVADQQTTTLNLDAKLKSAMIVVQFSEAFDLYFRSYEVTLKSPSDASYTWYEEENRPLYLQAGDMILSMKMRSVTGKQVTIEGTKISTTESTMYNVSLDVNGGEVGKSAISISFDDATTLKPITLEINDDIVDADAPLITVVGFESGKQIDVIEGEGADVKPKFHIVATAGVKEVWLTTTGDYMLGQGMPQEVNLASEELSPEVIDKLNSLGLITKGLLTGKDKMAVVDLSGLVRSLRANSNGDATTFSLRVVDAYGRCYPEEGQPEPTLVVDAEALQFNVSNAETIPVGAKETSFVVTTNGKGDELDKNLEITALDTDGLRNPVEILGVEPVQEAEGAYRVTVTLPLRNDDPKIEYTYRGGAIVPANSSVAMDYSEAVTRLTTSWTTQNRALVRVANRNLMRLARAIYVDDKEIPVAASMRKDETGEILIDENAGLTPATTYEVSISFLANPSPDNAPAVNVRTASIVEVPNGDFEDLEDGVSRENMDEGGEYTRTQLGSAEKNKQTFQVQKPTGWTTTNLITASEAAVTQNSWFVIPSVYSTDIFWESTTHTFSAGFGGQTRTPEIYDYSSKQNQKAKSGNSAMVIRNVGYDLNGRLPDVDKGTSRGPSDYYSRKAPTLSSRMAGRLMLDATINPYTPKALNLWYIYKEDSNDGGETGEIKVELIRNEENTGHVDVVLATGYAELPQQANSNEFVQVSVPIEYKELWRRPNKLKITIRSTNHRRDEDIKVTNYTSLHEQSARGAMLTVDNLTFEY